MKQFVLDGMPINADVPYEYPGPLQFFTAPLEDTPKLLCAATGLPTEQALQRAVRDKTIIAVSADERWVAMVNTSPQNQFWVEVVEVDPD